jgi:mono/diheme cytochrome c family protein
MRSAALSLAALIALVWGAGCEPADETDEWSQNEVFQRMQRQPKFKSYQRNDFFPDARAMRLPPAGTVSRQGFEQGKGIDSGLTPQNTFVETVPVPVDEALLETGRKNFQIVCAACHGVAGDGKSMVAMNFGLMPPPSFHSEKLRSKPDGYIFEAITRGFGAMPGQGWRFTPKDRWAVVAYVRALQYSQHAPIAEAPQNERTRLLREGQ